MQHVTGFGYPTPPASPVYDNNKCSIQQPLTAPHCQARCIPLTPEERLGRFLEGKLQLTTILGTGAYGVVYSAVDVKTGVRYAVKCLSKFNPDGTPLDRRQVAFQNREIRLHYAASAHPNVVSMLKIVDDPDCIYVILEHCPEGDLFFNITECGQYVGNDELAKSVFLQILDAVEHCHRLGIYHRDLKPENILVSDRGQTVKLADFGLATSSDRSEDYGCGSTFYMSPECLDHSARRPFYLCAPNDVWSLGVILVNLTCGRNPWKQASFEDSTYRAYTRCPETLKSILPVSDELNDILGRIFTRNPDQRITLGDLKERIQACPRFTIPPPVAVAVPVPTVLATPPISPEHTIEYVTCEDAVAFSYETTLSPASSSSDEGSDCSSDDGSLTSSGSTIDDLDEEFIQEQQQETCHAQAYEPEEHRANFFPAQEFVPQHYTGPVPTPVAVHEPNRHQMPLSMPPQAQMQAPSCPPKSFVPFWWGDVVKYAQQAPAIHPHVPFHHQVPIFAHLQVQGCY
ncbi:Ran1-like protein kinase [Colletotrichum plurivorum]|uniref:Autophagy-related protein 1 n=1 Tax=Colletotrichum plurivorum TaxID=2175906 RepID=A0A8H6K054_9PEZI|nr:Ran1-like protein kinase [Colletotrichum plurivorum]